MARQVLLMLAAKPEIREHAPEDAAIGEKERTAEFKTQCGTTTVSKLPALNGLTHLQLAIEVIWTGEPTAMRSARTTGRLR
jgi:hypothetical protein